MQYAVAINMHTCLDHRLRSFCYVQFTIVQSHIFEVIYRRGRDRLPARINRLPRPLPSCGVIIADVPCRYG